MQATDDTIQQAKMVGERVEREPRKSWINQGFHQDGESACGGIYLVLTANVPHGERNVLVLYSLHVETWTQRGRFKGRRRDSTLD